MKQITYLFLSLLIPIAGISVEKNADSQASFIYFESNINGDRVDITWETKNQQNINHFIIEKSRDGKAFEEAFKTFSSEKGLAYMNYFNADFDVWEGKTYYRLSQVDNEGRIITSEIISVVYNNDGLYHHHKTVDIEEREISFDELVDNKFDTVEYEEILVVLKDRRGQELFSKVAINKASDEVVSGLDKSNTIPEGKYIIVASQNDDLLGRKIKIIN